MGLSHSRNYRKIKENNIEEPLLSRINDISNTIEVSINNNVSTDVINADNNVSTDVINADNNVSTDVIKIPSGIKRLPERSLYEWSLLGYCEEVVWLIKNGSDVNKMNQFGQTLLYSSLKHPKIVKEFIDNGCSLSSIDINEKTPLIHACEFDAPLETIKLLLSNGSDVNAKDNQGKTPLYYASGNEKIDIVNLLIQNGADVNVNDKYCKETPLFNASSKGRIEIVKLLLQNGAERYHKNILDNTPYENTPKCFKEMMFFLK